MVLPDEIKQEIRIQINENEMIKLDGISEINYISISANDDSLDQPDYETLDLPTFEGEITLTQDNEKIIKKLKTKIAKNYLDDYKKTKREIKEKCLKLPERSHITNQDRKENK